MKDLDAIFQDEIEELVKEFKEIGEDYSKSLKNIGRWEELGKIMHKLGYTDEHINEMKKDVKQ